MISSSAIVLLAEIAGNGAEMNGRSVRVTGKTVKFDPVTATVIISDEGVALKVSTELLDPTQYRPNHMVQFIGEIRLEADESPVLYARIGRSVEGMDMKLYKEALLVRRQFLEHNPIES